MAATSTRTELLTCLREAQVLPAETLDRLDSKTSDTVMPVGVILRQRGKLTMAQLIELSHMKSANPGTRLGELAVKQGWCTERDVEEALVEQERRSHLLDLVMAEPDCDAVLLARALVRYAKVLEERMNALSSASVTASATISTPVQMA